MVDILEILDMIDWRKPSETQSKGISLASKFENIVWSEDKFPKK